MVCIIFNLFLICFVCVAVHPVSGVPALEILSKEHWNETYTMSSILMKIQVREREIERETYMQDSSQDFGIAILINHYPVLLSFTDIRYY